MEADRCLPFGGNVDEPHDPGMGLPLNDGQLPEVFVESDENPAGLIGAFKNFFISGVPLPIRCGYNINAVRCELVARSAPDATVQEEPHPSVPVAISRGSTRSCPTSRRA